MLVVRVLKALVVLLFALDLSTAQARPVETPGVLDEGVASLALAGHWAMLVDEDGSLSLDDVRSRPEVGVRFEPLATVLAAGFQRKTYWLRATLTVAPAGVGDWMLEMGPPILDDLRVYAPDRAGRYHETRFSDLVAFDQRPMAHHQFVLPLSIERAGPVVVYFRLATHSTSRLEAQLIRRETFLAKQGAEYTVLGLFFGGLGTIFLINSLYSFWTRDRIFLRYAAAVGAYFIVAGGLSGWLAEFVFPDSPRIVDVLPQVGFLLLNGFNALFIAHILNARETAPRLFLVWRGMAALNFLCLFSIPFDRYIDIIGPVVAAHTVLMCTGVVFVRRVWNTLHESRWVLAGFLIAHFSGGVSVLRALGWVSSDPAVDELIFLSTLR